MPGDNSANIASGGNVLFPQNGSSVVGNITNLNDGTFKLLQIGIYLVQFQVSINEPGQLCVKLNNSELSNTMVGRATGTSQIVVICLITTITSNSILSICNPLNNSTALTITPFAGGSNPVSAHLVILQLSVI